jgi:hypothetical protein
LLDLNISLFVGTYYAAQVGIGLKAKDTASRNYLFELLGALEKLKKDIGPTDAIDIEAASAAFVENFALRVFGMADNEDRSGAGNRSAIFLRALYRPSNAVCTGQPQRNFWLQQISSRSSRPFRKPKYLIL